MVIKAGSSLLVPRSTRFELDVALQVADHGQLSLASEPAAKKVKKGKGGKASRAGAGKGKAGAASAVHKAAKPARPAKPKRKTPA